MKKKVKFAFKVFLTIFLLYFGHSKIICETIEDVEYKKAWGYYYQQEADSAYEIVKKWNNSRSDYRDGWNVLLSWVLLKQEKYQEALDVLNKNRDRLEKAYVIIKYKLNENSKEWTIEKRDSLFFLYYRMLFVSGFSNFGLGNYKLALKDFIEFESEGEKEDHIYFTIAVCYYQIGEYKKSGEYFKKTFNLASNEKTKSIAAYNIAALYSIEKSVEASIEWLKIPFEHDRNLWLQKIKNDKDFDTIRNNRKFIEFLRQQEGMAKKKIFIK